MREWFVSEQHKLPTMWKITKPGVPCAPNLHTRAVLQPAVQAAASRVFRRRSYSGRPASANECLPLQCQPLAVPVFLHTKACYIILQSLIFLSFFLFSCFLILPTSAWSCCTKHSLALVSGQRLTPSMVTHPSFDVPSSSRWVALKFGSETTQQMFIWRNRVSTGATYSTAGSQPMCQSPVDMDYSPWLVQIFASEHSSVDVATSNPHTHGYLLS